MLKEIFSIGNEVRNQGLMIMAVRQFKIAIVFSCKDAPRLLESKINTECHLAAQLRLDSLASQITSASFYTSPDLPIHHLSLPEK